MSIPTLLLFKDGEVVARLVAPSPRVRCFKRSPPTSSSDPELRQTTAWRFGRPGTRTHELLRHVGTALVPKRSIRSMTARSLLSRPSNARAVAHYWRCGLDHVDSFGRSELATRSTTFIPDATEFARRRRGRFAGASRPIGFNPGELTDIRPVLEHALMDFNATAASVPTEPSLGLPCANSRD